MKLFPHMAEVSSRVEDIGMLILYWRRQSYKTTWLAWYGLKIMAKHRASLFTLVSASLNVGAELTEKEARVYQEVIADLRKEAEQSGLKLTTNGDKLQWDDYLDLLDKSRLEVRLYHTNTVYSRTKIIAPNVATARGYSGWVGLDEFGFIRDFRELYEAVEPIASGDPSFRIVMATTAPDDDTHYSYELLVPPEGMTFFTTHGPRAAVKPNGRGTWYESTAGITVHRFDAWDAHAAGIALYDKKTRLPLSPEEHRAQALDRDAWDRNYGLALKAGGKAAVSLVSVHEAMQRGAGRCLAAEDDFPEGWRRLLGDGRIAIGADPATTEGEKSNPFAITVLEQGGADYLARLIVRFKTNDPEKAKAFLREACDLGPGRRPHRLVLDATSERFWCAEVKREFSRICPVALVVASEKTTYQGQEVLYKEYLGNLLVNTLDDGHVPLPDVRWVKDDFRLVFRQKGSFDNHVDSAGNHGDTFDSTKLALHGLVARGGPTQAAGVQVGTYGRPHPGPPRLVMRPDQRQEPGPSGRAMP